MRKKWTSSHPRALLKAHEAKQGSSKLLSMNTSKSNQWNLEQVTPKIQPLFKKAIFQRLEKPIKMFRKVTHYKQDPALDKLKA